MIKQLNKARSTFNSLTGGGSYPNLNAKVYATASRSYCYIREPKVERLSRAARRGKKTAAISLQSSYLLNLLAKDDSEAKNPDAANPRGGASDFSWAQPLPRWKRNLDVA